MSTSYSLPDHIRSCIKTRAASLSFLPRGTPFTSLTSVRLFMAKTRKKRQVYTPQQRAEILAAASRHSYTAAQVKRKFGVTPVTYYLWRKKSGATRRRGASPRAGGVRTGGTFGLQLRSEVQNRVRQ